MIELVCNQSRLVGTLHDNYEYDDDDDCNANDYQISMILYNIKASEMLVAPRISECFGLL